MNKIKYSQDSLHKEKEEIEYVIYCRRSSDESSEKQVASIPQQIEECIKFAEREGLKIKVKPENFPEQFETQREVEAENNDESEANRGTYKNTRHLYIIKESASAKTYRNRPKWTKIVQMIRSGKIRGLISYSPDRQSRNMLEGGEIIDCVDENDIDLKYTNFHFEPKASGKMMLGIWFVFSKQYSDKLSEDISRSNRKKATEGESLGDIKHGYQRGKDGKWEIEPNNFPIIQWAFKEKLETKASDKKMVEEINKRGFLRKFENGRESPMTTRMIEGMWVDSFYYGIWIRADYENIVLQDVAPNYKPMITLEEHEIFMSRYKAYEERLPSKRGLNKEDEKASIRAIGNNFIIDKKGNKYTLGLPNPARFNKRLKKLQEKNPKAVLADVVEPHQIIFKPSGKKQSISFDVIDKAVMRKLKTLRLSDEMYMAYLGKCKQHLEKTVGKIQVERKKFQLRVNQLSGKRIEYIKTHLAGAGQRNEDEENIYQAELKKIDDEILFYTQKIEELLSDEDVQILDINIAVKTLQSAEQEYRNSSYVRKGKIIKFLFSNAIRISNKRVDLKVKEGLESFFTTNGGDGRNRTAVQ